MLLLAVKSKEATFVVTLLTADTQSRGRDTEGFWDNPHPSKKKQPRQEAQKELLKV